MWNYPDTQNLEWTKNLKVRNFDVSNNIFCAGKISSSGTVSGAILHGGDIECSNNFDCLNIAQSKYFVGTDKILVRTANPITSADFYCNAKGIFGNSITAARDALGIGQRALALIDDTAVMKIFRVDAVNAATMEFLQGTSSAIAYGTGVRWWDIGMDTTGFYFRERTGGINNRLFIKENTGYIGVGTSSPSEIMQVEGNICASGAGVFKKNGSLGVGGAFTTADSKTITVSGGIIISIV